MPLPLAPATWTAPARVDRQRDAGQHGAPPAPDRERPRLEQHRHGSQPSARPRTSVPRLAQPPCGPVRHRGMSPRPRPARPRPRRRPARSRRIRRRRRSALVAAVRAAGRRQRPRGRDRAGPRRDAHVVRPLPAAGHGLPTGPDRPRDRGRPVERRGRPRRRAGRGLRDGRDRGCGVVHRAVGNDRRREPRTGRDDRRRRRRARPAHAAEHAGPERDGARRQRPRRPRPLAPAVCARG